jgi:serine O-acetyltransferase
MITSRSELKLFLQKDFEARKYKYRPYSNDKSLYGRILYYILKANDIGWQWNKLFRKAEYYKNKKQHSLCYAILYRYHKLSMKLGYGMPLNVFGYGLNMMHYGTVVVNDRAKIGNHCSINIDVVIGQNKLGKCPVIGDNCKIHPGAKIFGDITIGDNVEIGANAVVNKSFPSNVVIAGVPAKIIKYK